MSFINQITAITAQFSMGGQDCLQLINGVFYLFGVTWVADDPTAPIIQVLKSSNDGVTWTSVTFGPLVRNFTAPNTTHNWIACVPEGTTVRVFYCSDVGTSSETGLAGLLSVANFSTLTDTFSGGATSDFNPFFYTYDNVSVYALSSNTSLLHITARKFSDNTYQIIFPSEFNTVTQVSTRATTTFNGSVFSATKFPLTEGGSYPGVFIAGLVDPTTDTFTVLFRDLSSIPYQGVLNSDGTIDRVQDFSFNDVSLAKFAYIDSGKMSVNWAERPTSLDIASLLSGTSNSDPISLVQENVDSAYPVGNNYIQNPQTAVFNNADTCYCAFLFAKKVGATEMHLLKSFKVGSFWFDYSIEVSFSDATVNVDTNALAYNYSGLFHDSNKFSMVAGGNSLRAPFGTPAAFPVYFARGDISFHASCITVVHLLVQVSDSMTMTDSVSTLVGTVGGGTPVHTCPEVIVSSSFCANIKTASDDETPVHDCEEVVFSETTQPCLEVL